MTSPDIPLATRVTFLYGSQTGNAESIALNLQELAQQRGYDTQCHVLDDYENVAFTAEDVYVFVVSTTGDGDPPDNATKFWRYLRRLAKKGADWSHVRYALLGLGDTNYDNFCNGGRRLDQKLQEIHAQTFYPRGLADDATGLEEVVEPWCQGLWEPVAKVCRSKASPLADAALDQSQPAQAKASTHASQPNTIEQSLAALHLDGTPQLPSFAVPSTSLASIQLDVWRGQALAIDYSALAELSSLTGTPKVPGILCQLEPVSPAALTNSDPTALVLPAHLSNAFTLVQLTKARCLTAPDAVKRTLHLTFAAAPGKNQAALPTDASGGAQLPEFRPGDAFGVVCPNPLPLVHGCLDRLGYTTDDTRHQQLAVQPGKPGGKLPSHLQSLSTVTPHQLFASVLDLTSAPKKALLRMLVDYTDDQAEKKRLLFLCSKQGATEFNSVRNQLPTLLDLLTTFPTVSPPLSRLVDALSPHQPRYYSVTNSPLADGGRTLSIAFNVVQYTTPEPYNVVKHGICTPWLDALATATLLSTDDHSQSATATINQPSATTARSAPPSPLVPAATPVYVFLRPNSGQFYLPSDLARPMILIGPGTGVAPFIGFLQHRDCQRQAVPGASPKVGETWLFYGCRHPDKDYLFRDELTYYQQQGVLSQLHVCFSRYHEPTKELGTAAQAQNGKDKSAEPSDVGRAEAAHPKYVQDNLRRHAIDIYRLLTVHDAMLYVCGDAKGMAREVDDALAEILANAPKCHGDPLAGLTLPDAKQLLVQWILDKRYLRDLVSWI
ncbi:hypothetical protein H4R34_002910 [Dimargaris verticillata]|uniref:Methionine synthase reductase n=1 Tax=Dimargaris verticillata TaxID=2761393 RepID=A0A9W8B0Z7_9FUNG|nr:hypothetical protein H4R34_002910 [Dimargaris verticillata]